MTIHGVGHLAFEWARGKRQIGGCHYYMVRNELGRSIPIPVKISLSRHFAELLTADEIRDTILHEIAHARALQKGYRGHGIVWQHEAITLGVKPAPCKAVTASPAKSVKGYCLKCEKTVVEQHRMPLRVYFHKGCGLNREDALVWFKNGVRVWPADMPARYRAEYNRLKG